MADDINIVVRAQDEFSSVLGNFGNIMTGIKSTIDLVGMAFNTAKDLLQPFIDSASESELALVGLENVIKSAGVTSGITEQQLLDLSSALQSVTRYSDEEIQGAEAMLLRFENLNPIMEDATRLTLDYAASLGIDLTSAAQTIGKALDDPASGIGRLNTQFKLFNETEMDTIKKMAENGQVAEAQAMIMDRLREKVGGAAEAFGNTFAGQLDITKNKLDDIRETIGGPILIVLGDLLDKFNLFLDTNPAIKATKDFFTELKDLMDNGIQPLAALGISFVDLGKALDNIGLSQFGETLLQIRSYIASGDDPFTAIKKSIDDVLSAYPDGPLAPILSGIQNFINTGQSEGWGAAISDVIGSMFSTITDVALPYINIMGENLITILGNTLKNTDWSPLSETIAGVLSTSIEIMFVRMNLISNLVTKIDWMTIAKSLFNSLVDAFEKVIDSGADSLIAALAKAFGDPDVATFQAGVQVGANKLGKALLAVIFPPSLASDAWGRAFDIAEEIINGLKDGISWNDLKSFFSFGFDDLINMIKRIFGVASPSTVFSEIARNLVLGLMQGWTGLFSTFKSLISSGIDEVLKLFAPFLALFGVDVSSSSVGGASGSFGGFGGTTTTTGNTTSTKEVKNYFYGPVYFQGAGEPGSYYDCPSPNPFMTATDGSPSTSGI